MNKYYVWCKTLESKKFKELVYIASLIIASICIYIFQKSIINHILVLPSYFAIFLISFVGTCSIMVPIPYTAIIFILSGSWGLDPLIVAFVGGVGSGLGQMTGWIVGRLMAKTLEDTRYEKQIRALIRFAEAKGRYVVPLIIFAFALTPLPDNILFIVLGVLNYKPLYVLTPCIIGKVVMLYLVSFFGKLMWELAQGVGLSDELIMAMTMIALVAILAALMLVRWDRILERYVKEQGAEHAQRYRQMV